MIQRGELTPFGELIPWGERVDPIGGLISMRLIDSKEGVDPMGGVNPFREGLILKWMKVL